MLISSVTVIRSADILGVDLGRALVAALAVGPSAVVYDHRDQDGTDVALHTAFNEVDAYLRHWSGTPLLLHMRDNEDERALSAHPIFERVTAWPSLEDAVAAAQLPPLERLSLTLAPDLAAPRRARDLADEALRGWDAVRLETDVKLALTEIVTNAVVHARTEMTVSITRHRWGQAIHVAVRDGSSSPPVPGTDTDLLAPGRRGMLIVGYVTRGWGTVPLDGGKVVWAVLDDQW